MLMPRAITLILVLIPIANAQGGLGWRRCAITSLHVPAILALFCGGICTVPALGGEIHDAARNGNLDKVQELLKNDPALVSKRSEGSTPLHFAAGYGHMDIAKLLLASGADVNAKDSAGETPLHWAGRRENIVELLLLHRADPNAKDHDGNTPLHTAAANGRKELAKLLLAHGADVNAKDKDGNTPLQLAAMCRHWDVTKILLAHGANPGANWPANLRSGAAHDGPTAAEQTATLKGGGGCEYNRHGRLKCHHFHLAGDDTPLVSRIDGKGPDSFGEKGQLFNGSGWNSGFTVRIPAGPHTITVAYYSQGPSGVLRPGRYTWSTVSSGYTDTFFIAEVGHTYTVNSILTYGRGWQPIVLDESNKNVVNTVVPATSRDPRQVPAPLAEVPHTEATGTIVSVAHLSNTNAHPANTKISSTSIVLQGPDNRKTLYLLDPEIVGATESTLRVGARVHIVCRAGFIIKMAVAE